MIDLRSDTVTKPTPQMMQAIADALLGDAVMGEDPTVERLEKRTAEILGKEAALFTPSATMANQIAARVHCKREGRFLCEAESHVYHYEQGGYASLSGLVAHCIATDDGALRTDQLQASLLPDDQHFSRTHLLWLENTQNRWGGVVQSQPDVVAACQWASSRGLKTHLDGSRIWNAAIASGVTEAELCAPFDSISVCFSKGLGAPIGAAVVGTKEFIHEAHRARKVLGGGMRQVGIVASAALHAVEHHRERLAEDHVHAVRLGEAVKSCQPFSIRRNRIDSNIVVVEIDSHWGDASKLVERLESRAVKCFDIGPQAIRLVTHLDVDAKAIDQACEAITASVAK